MFRLPASLPMTLNDLFTPIVMGVLSKSSKLLWRITICNLLWCIWTERNRLLHEGGLFSFSKLKHFFVTSLKESAGLAFVPSSSPASIPIFGFLGLSQLCPAARKFFTVVWRPPLFPWVKVNTDGSFRDPDHAGFGGIARGMNGVFTFAFAARVRVPCALDAEILAFLEAIRVARLRDWPYVWIETDSAVVVRYFRSPSLVPWRLRTRWRNGMVLARQLHLRVTHIFREGNGPADVLANYGASIAGAETWDVLPQFLSPSFGRDFSSQPRVRCR